MVNTGRRSRGCQRCRQRRKKCDERKPRCSNCQNLGYDCPGYSDPVDLIFIDDGERYRKQISNTNLQWRFYGKATTFPMTKDMLPALEQHAVNILFGRFVLPDRGSWVQPGFLKLLIPMYSEAASTSTLKLATEAFGVRLLAIMERNVLLQHRAQELYRQAMVHARAAIEGKSSALHGLTNGLLLSVLLFCLYEALEPSSSSSSDSWSQHARGAVAIVLTRGSAMLKEERSSILFRATRTQMLNAAYQQQTNTPPFPGPFGWLSDSPGNPTGSLGELMIRLANLSAGVQRVKKLGIVCDAELRLMLKDGDSLIKDFSKWETQLPEKFTYRTVLYQTRVSPTKDQSPARSYWPGPVHVYGDAQAASLRNYGRALQVSSCQAVFALLHLLGYGFCEAKDIYDSVVSRIQQLADDIAAAVPFYFKGNSYVEGTGGDELHDEFDDEIAYFLLWPLLVASKTEEISWSQRQWMRQTMNTVVRLYDLEESDIIQARTGEMLPVPWRSLKTTHFIAPVNWLSGIANDAMTYTV